MGEKLTLPPSWGEDELSKYFNAVQGNQWATFAQQPAEYVLHQRIDNWLDRLTSGFINPKNEIVAMLVLRSHLIFRTASSLSAAGDLYSSMSVQRSCAETSAYALVLARDDQALDKWMARTDSDDTKKEARNSFIHSKIIKIIRKDDVDLEKTYDTIYQRSIDFGAHPNSSGIFTSTEIERKDGNTHIKQAGLHGPGTQFTLGLKSTSQVGVFLIRICELIWPERVQLLSLYDELWALRQSC